MAYSTPHTAREYLYGACLKIHHEHVLMCRGRSIPRKRKMIRAVREIDLCRYLASYFGHSATLAAQGTSEEDLKVKAPTIRAEVKYLRPPARNYSAVHKDWDWLTRVSSSGDEFDKRAWVIFWPSARSDMHDFTNCVSVPKGHGSRYSLEDFAPFVPYAEPEMPQNGTNQRLAFKKRQL